MYLPIKNSTKNYLIELRISRCDVKQIIEFLIIKLHNIDLLKVHTW